MKNADIIKSLNEIRAELDKEVPKDDIEALVQHGHNLKQLTGLAANCYAQSKARYHKALSNKIKIMMRFAQMNKAQVQPTLFTKMAEGECFEEAALMDYSERITKGITNALDFVRSCISLHKSELENAMK